MADKKFYSNIDLTQSSSIKNGGFEVLAADPASPVEGQQWHNSTDNKSRIFLNGVICDIACETWVTDQINMLERSQGAFDAAPGALPTVADKTQGDLTTLHVGDQWVVTNAGTITGIQGADLLSIGDKLEFLGGTATDPNNWLGIQRNLDDTLLGNTVADRQTVSLVADTGLTVSSSIVSDIHSIEVYDSTGAQIEVCINKTANANERVLTSNATLAGVVVELLGPSS